MDTLESRVDALERQCLLLTKEMGQAQMRAVEAQQVNQAFQKSIRALGSEIAERYGVSAEQYLDRFQSLCRWHHDEILRTSSDRYPGETAAIDKRSIDEIPTDEIAPRILDSHSDDGK